MSATAIASSHLTFRPLSRAVGAEVLGLDMKLPFSDEDARSLREAFNRFGLLLVRGQPISTDQQTAVAELVGTVVIREKNVVANAEEKAQHVSNARKDGILGLGEIDFHMDQLFHQTPLLGLILYGIEIPSRGGQTKFIDTCAVYASLPQSLRARIDQLSCRHAYTFDGDLAVGWNIDSAKVQPLSAVHPMAPRHPVTGKPALWVNKMTTVEVIGLPADEGQALMQEVRSYLYAEGLTYTHEWQPHDLLLWDNRSLMHARMPFDESQPRTLRRSPIL